MFFSTFKKVSSICQMWFMVHFYCIWYFAWGQSISLKLWLRNHDLKESKVFFSQSFFFMWNILYLKKGYNTLHGIFRNTTMHKSYMFYRCSTLCTVCMTTSYEPAKIPQATISCGSEKRAPFSSTDVEEGKKIYFHA